MILLVLYSAFVVVTIAGKEPFVVLENVDVVTLIALQSAFAMASLILFLSSLSTAWRATQNRIENIFFGVGFAVLGAVQIYGSFMYMQDLNKYLCGPK
jgi:hypothetical protein